MANTPQTTPKFSIALAVIAGLLALGMVFIFLNKINKSAKEKQTKKYTGLSKDIMVAVRDLPSGHVISVNDDLKKITIPAEDDLADFARVCVDAQNAQELEGRKLGTVVPTSYPLMYANLLDTYSLEKEFTEGSLITLPFSKENFFGSQLMPGDHVDILVTMSKKAPSSAPPVVNLGNGRDVASAMMRSMLAPSQNTEMETKVVLENVEVFMVNSALSMNRMQLGYDPQASESSNEISFRLDQKDAVTLTKYRNTPGAVLSLLLRPRLQK